MALTKVSSGLISADASSVDLNIDAGTLYIDATNNRVGIGTASPDTLNHLLTSTTSAITPVLKLQGNFTANDSSEGTSIDFVGSSDATAVGSRIIGTRAAAGGNMDLRFHTARDTFAMIIDESQNVGIGTTSPSAKLDVYQGELKVTGTLANWSVDHQGVVMDFTRASTSYIRASNAAGQLQFQTGGSNNRMIISSSGNVGIGTSSPSAPLHVKSGANNDNSIITIEGATNNIFELGYATQGAFLNSAAGDPMVFRINETERMRIDSSGNLLVGTTSTAGVATNTKLVLGGIFSTHRSNASVANATTTTIATLPSGDGNYIVSAALLGSSSPAAYNEVAIVGVSGSSSTITTLQNASALNLSMSGLNLQVYHNQGATQTILFSILRIY